MKYLDERIYINFVDLVIPATGLYKYKVIETGEDELLFIGNLFLKKGQTELSVDVTDIVRNYLSGKKTQHSFYISLTVVEEDD